ncbi:hypothetical protein B0J11DRAFT_48342 [Dendryphion nanum]|uniref:Uncharacterized protein n=1 Tax=Dendryphion nanum TaxID=256645 RepID=A0A9P9IIR1_9PLEO|nr:hypothetical protein B0J11DRAFT_48342 [Dendryphion nanum]
MELLLLIPSVPKRNGWIAPMASVHQAPDLTASLPLPSIHPSMSPPMLPQPPSRVTLRSAPARLPPSLSPVHRCTSNPPTPSPPPQHTPILSSHYPLQPSSARTALRGNSPQHRRGVDAGQFKPRISGCRRGPVADHRRAGHVGAYLSPPGVTTLCPLCIHVSAPFHPPESNHLGAFLAPQRSDNLMTILI